MESVDHIAARVRGLFRALLRRADAIRERGAPARAEQGVLAWLDEKGPMAPSALAAAQKVRPQTMGQTLDALERHRWIKRGPHPRDRRQVLISLSASGQKALTRGRGLRQAWLVGELGRLTPRERETVVAALGILERFIPSDTPTPSKS
jgi:DNA-binding MarR family transcriptional regulator